VVGTRSTSFDVEAGSLSGGIGGISGSCKSFGGENDERVCSTMFVHEVGRAISQGRGIGTSTVRVHHFVAGRHSSIQASSNDGELGISSC